MLVASVLAAVAPASALARPNRTPGTGLRTINFAKVPPDFAFDLGDGRTRLSEHFGKPVVLSFWGTWCHPCVEELESFARLRESYAQSATLITLSAEAPGVARKYLAARQLELPVVEDLGGKISAAYSVQTLPTTIVLKPDGTVAYVSIGELTWDELSRAVDAAQGPAKASSG